MLLSLLSACEDKRTAPQNGKPEISVGWSRDLTNLPAKNSFYEDVDFVLEVKKPSICERETPLHAKDGSVRISVPISVQARTAREVPVSALSFTLEDPDGHRYRPTLAGCTPALKQQRLKQEDKITSEVAFDVPRTATKFELHFDPFLLGRDKVTARVVVPERDGQ